MRVKRINNLKLGLFVAIGVLFLIFTIYMVGRQQHLFGGTFTLRAVFPNVSGLQGGNNVRFSGITVGSVDKIRLLTDTTVEVEMSIDNDARKFIKKDARAMVSSEGLMGNKIISILPGSPDGEPVESGDLIVAAPPLDVEDILHKLRKTSENLAVMTNDLSAITSKIKRGEGAVGTLIMDSVFAENLRSSIRDVSESAKTTSLQLKSVTGDVAQVTENVKSITKDLKEGRGLAGALLTDSMLADDLRQAIRQTRQGAQGFSENMEAVKSSFLFRGYYKNRQKKTNEELDQDIRSLDGNGKGKQGGKQKQEKK